MHTNPLFRSPDWIKQKYEVEQKSIVEIALEAGASSTAVSRAMQRHGILSRTPLETRTLRGNTTRKSAFPMLNRAWLEQRYGVDGLSAEEVAVEVGCTTTHILKTLKRLGVPRRPSGGIRPGKTRSDRHERLYDEVWLREQYLTLRRPIAEIAVEAGCAESTLIGALARYRIHRKEPRPKTNEEAVLDVRRYKTSTSSTGKHYIKIWMPEHPYERMGYVPEHRLVCEKALGRYLTPKEVVHHVNEDSADNRADNLMVFPNNATHMSFHAHPPAWVPRCECCGHACPERLAGRPTDIPMEWRPQ